MSRGSSGVERVGAGARSFGEALFGAETTGFIQGDLTLVSTRLKDKVARCVGAPRGAGRAAVVVEDGRLRT